MFGWGEHINIHSFLHLALQRLGHLPFLPEIPLVTLPKVEWANRPFAFRIVSQTCVSGLLLKEKKNLVDSIIDLIIMIVKYVHTHETVILMLIHTTLKANQFTIKYK